LHVDPRAVEAHFDSIAKWYDAYGRLSAAYRRAKRAWYAARVPAGRAVVEIGCGTGDILASVEPGLGVGVDRSRKMLRRARQKHSVRPGLRWIRADADGVPLRLDRFDAVLLPDVVDHLPDVWTTLRTLARRMRPGAEVLATFVSPAWAPLYRFLEFLGLKAPTGPKNWLALGDIEGLMRLAGFEVLEARTAWLGLHQRIRARRPDRLPAPESLRVSVVIPCHNEEGNILPAVERMPEMGAGTEIVFVDDGSTDGTWAEMEEAARRDRRVRLVPLRPNRGKAAAVVAGFEAATGDVLMICDADLTVAPEELPSFLAPIAEGRADFVNGTRMVYPMEDEAMRFLNHVGNRFFSIVLSWIMGVRITDTLCGTKVLRKRDRPAIPMGRDPWGDYDLLFGAARNGLRIVEMTVHYRARQAGVSKMRTFKHAVVLLKMTLRGFLEVKLPRILGRLPPAP
jgi:ubiquinone/menaquinone biosynthesis C-methylase UbiE